MKVVFERETEIGRCDSDALMVGSPYSDGDSRCAILANTTGILTGSKRMLKIEHRCYLRSGEDLPEQNWVKPEMTFEPSAGSEDEMIPMLEKLHQQFLNRARKQIPESFLDSP